MEAQKAATLAGHGAAIYAFAEGRQPDRVFSAGGDGWIVDWDLRSPDLGRLAAKAQAQLFSLCFLKEKNAVIAGDMNGGVRWISLENPAEQKNSAHHRRGVFSIQHIENQVFTLGGDGFLSRWDVESCLPSESIQLSSKSLRSFSHSKKNGLMAIGSSDGALSILSAQSLAVERRIEAAHGFSVFALAFSNDGRTLFSAGRDAMLRAWAVERNFEKTTELPAHLLAINALAVHPSEPLLATASRDKTVKIWATDGELRLLKVLETVRNEGHLRSANCLFWSKTPENWLISGSDDRTAIVWKIEP